MQIYINVVFFITSLIGLSSSITSFLVYMKTKDIFLKHFLVMFFGFSLFMLSLVLLQYSLSFKEHNWFIIVLFIQINKFLFFFMMFSIIYYAHYINLTNNSGIKNGVAFLISMVCFAVVFFNVKIDIVNEALYNTKYLNIVYFIFIFLMIYTLIITVNNFIRLQDKDIKKSLGEFMILNLIIVPFLIFDFIAHWNVSIIRFNENNLLLFVFPLFYSIISIIFLYHFYNNNFFIMDTPFKAKTMSDGFLNKYTITPREAEVLQCLMKGSDNKKIAVELDIKVVTVKKHLANIFQKTGLKGRFELIIAIKNF